jgi:hypothetical protein
LKHSNLICHSNFVISITFRVRVGIPEFTHGGGARVGSIVAVERRFSLDTLAYPFISFHFDDLVRLIAVRRRRGSLFAPARQPRGVVVVLRA